MFEACSVPKRSAATLPMATLPGTEPVTCKYETLVLLYCCILCNFFLLWQWQSSTRLATSRVVNLKFLPDNLTSSVLEQCKQPLPLCCWCLIPPNISQSVGHLICSVKHTHIAQHFSRALLYMYFAITTLLHCTTLSHSLVHNLQEAE